MNYLLFALYCIPIAWLIRRDNAQRDGISTALWIPTIWIGILSSRTVSAWLDFGGAVDTLEGSPLDRAFYFGMIVLSLIVLARRQVEWGKVIARSWPLFFFYGFLLVSVLWANSPFSSLKRWVKEFGNIAVALVILSEANPLQAIRAVFVRCAYFLIPLSIIFLRWFPSLGRRYSRSGGLEITGVTMQKNSLGVMILVCGLIFLWDWIERSKEVPSRLNRLDRYVAYSLAAMGLYLLWISDSKTSMLCFLLSGTVIAAIRFPLLRRRIGDFGMYGIVAVLFFFVVDRSVGLTEAIVRAMGRDMTFTGRTDVWRELLALDTNPIWGTGFMSFWDDMYYRSRLPEWVAFSAHNGYIEIYLAGGYLGIGALAVMLIGTAFKLNRALAHEDDYAAVRFAVFVTMLVGNFSESNFAVMTPIGFLFIIAVLGFAPKRTDYYYQDQLPDYTQRDDEPEAQPFRP